MNARVALIEGLSVPVEIEGWGEHKVRSIRCNEITKARAGAPQLFKITLTDGEENNLVFTTNRCDLGRFPAQIGTVLKVHVCSLYRTDTLESSLAHKIFMEERRRMEATRAQIAESFAGGGACRK